MKLVSTIVLSILFTLIACYSENLRVFSYGSLLLVLVYGVACFALVSSVHLSTLGDALRGLASFWLVAAVFHGILVIYRLSGQSLRVDWLTAIFFWIIISGVVMERFVRKTA